VSGLVSRRTSRPSAGGPGGRRGCGRPGRHGAEYRGGGPICQGGVPCRWLFPGGWLL